MTTPIVPFESPTERPLLDLGGLVAGIRWRRRMLAAFAVIGLLLGVAAATALPTRASATADVFVTHENEASGDGQSQMKTDLALLQTTSVAAVAVNTLRNGITPQDFVSMYSGAIVADNILEITARGATDAEALARVQAVANAFITVHVKQSSDAANATVKAYNDRRNQVQRELDDINSQIAAATSGADLQSLYNRRGALASQIASLAQQAEASGIGSPQVAAGTKILDAPHRTSHGFLVNVLLYGGIGLVAGLALGFLFAAVAAVVRDRPVLRRDLVAHLGASVVAQIPAPLRGPRKLIRRSSAEKERIRTAATLVRLLRESPKPVSVLELGCAPAAAALVKDMAEELAADHSVVVVDDLPGDQMTAALGLGSSVELVPGAQFPPVSPESRDAGTRTLAIGTVGPGTPWTDLRRLGAETLVVVRAGRTQAAWLHTVARQLADAGIAIIGLVVVHPDPRDKSDGTVWDALHTAVRGRVAAGAKAPALVAPPVAAAPPVPWPAAGAPWYPMQQPQPGYTAAAGRPGFANGSGPRRPDGSAPPTEAIPVGTQVMRIDSPTIVIPIHRDRTAGGKAAIPAGQAASPARPVDVVKPRPRAHVEDEGVAATVAIAPVVRPVSSATADGTADGVNEKPVAEDVVEVAERSGAVDPSTQSEAAEGSDVVEQSVEDEQADVVEQSVEEEQSADAELEVEASEPDIAESAVSPADSAEPDVEVPAQSSSEPLAADDREPPSHSEEPVSITRRPRMRPRPRPRPRLALADHPTDKFRPVVPGTPAKNVEAT